MSNLPFGMKEEMRARLFPVLSETSKEGRTTSVFLSCLTSVHEYGAALLGSLGQRIGSRATIEAFTEVNTLSKDGDKQLRPDGLLLLKVGSRTWSALVESKIGNNELTNEQIEGYLRLAQDNGIDAVITISNQFSASPFQHPIGVKPRSRSKVELFHWSWMYVLTEADLLVSNETILDADQHYILSELVRFLAHESAGVKGFDAMPKAWGDLAQMILAGGAVSPNSNEVKEVVSAWHQEVRDLSLILSRIIGVGVINKLPRALAADSGVRTKADIAQLCESKTLGANLVVQDAAGPIEIYADINHRTINASVRMQAPADKKSTKARLNWLMRQLQNAPVDDLHIRLNWPGRGPHTQHTLAELKENPALASDAKPQAQVNSFDICLVKQLGGRFVQSRNFIKDLEKIVPEFYRDVVENLKPWYPPAPRAREGRIEASDVTPDALSEDIDESRSTSS